MNSGEHILVSLDERHANNIFAGSKQVELRRRNMHVSVGSTMWIYVKKPVGSIQGSVRIRGVHSGSPSTLWRKFGSVSGLTRREFFSYFEGVSKGVALALDSSSRLAHSISLQEMRRRNRVFYPPQFFVRLEAGHPVREAVSQGRQSSPDLHPLVLVNGSSKHTCGDQGHFL